MSDLLHLTAPIEIIQAASGDGKPPRIVIVAYSGGEISPPGWPSVVFDLAGADVSGEIPILAGHDEELDSIIGQGRAEVHDGKQIIIQGHLTDATPAGAKVLALSRSGITLQASVGYQPGERYHVAASETVRVNGRSLTAGRQGLTIVRTGKLREVSLLPIGADAETSVTIAARSKIMIDALNASDQINAELRAQLPENQAGLCDSERVQARWARERWHNTSPGEGPYARAQKAMIAAAAGKITYSDFEHTLLEERVRDAELHAIRSERPPAPVIRAGGKLAGPLVLEAAVLRHLGHEALAEKQLGAQVIQAAADLRCHSILDVIKAGLAAEGRDIPHGPHEIIRAGFSTLSLPGILGNVAEKLMLDSYRAFPSVALLVAKHLSARNFKQHTGYKLSGDVALEQVGPMGELKHGVLTEAAYTYFVATYGRIFGLTRQDLINDDLGAFDEVPRMLGRGAAIALEETFWTLVLANTGSFFSGGNGNYISGATTNLSIASLGQAAALMRKQVDPQGHPISVTPKFLVVPPELETVADALFTSTNVVVAVATGAATDTVPESNPFKNKYQPLVVPHLSNDGFSGYSETGWYLFGDPADVAAFGIAFLSGIESPTIESGPADFDTLGLQWRGFLDFGTCQLDNKGAAKSKGAA